VTGGSATGGTATGGAGIGGANAGGGATGGTATGGNATGGAGIGGVSAGGSTTGGAASGGIGTGGSATGGTASVPLCATVASLPTMGTACTTAGESQCDADGNRCVCERIWYCNNTCATVQPSIPTAGSACTSGMACTYGSAGCVCVNLQWMCVGVSSCPDAANMPTSGDACNNLTGVVCDYPSTIHIACVCSSNADAGSGSTWTCVQSAYCPATQPAYDLAGSCPGTAMCTYGDTHCLCTQSGTPWVCI
jgi:hypothetical protein